MNNTDPIPHIIPSKDIPKVIEKIPSYTRFGFWGLSFYNNYLYVSTNIGLLKLRNDSVIALLKWKDGDDVISKPCYDNLTKKLWIFHDGLFELISFDGQNWHFTEVPNTRKGYTRGDILEGHRMTSYTQSFYLEGGGTYWKWSIDNNTWKEQITPQNFKKMEYYSFDSTTFENEGRLIRIIPMGKYVFCVMRFKDLFPGLSSEEELSDEIYYKDGEWKQVQNTFSISYFVEDVVSLNDSISYMLTEGKKIICLSHFKIDTINTIGQCDAIAKSSGNKLIASFRNLGIFVYENGWQKILDAPLQDKGKFWTFLSENKNEYVLSMTPENEKQKSRLWISSGKTMKEIKFEN